MPDIWEHLLKGLGAESERGLRRDRLLAVRRRLGEEECTVVLPGGPAGLNLKNTHASPLPFRDRRA